MLTNVGGGGAPAAAAAGGAPAAAGGAAEEAPKEEKKEEAKEESDDDMVSCDVSKGAGLALALAHLNAGADSCRASVSSTKRLASRDHLPTSGVTGV